MMDAQVGSNELDGWIRSTQVGGYVGRKLLCRYLYTEHSCICKVLLKDYQANKCWISSRDTKIYKTFSKLI